MLNRANQGDDRVDWRAQYLQDMVWMVEQVRAYEADLNQVVARQIDVQLSSVIGDLALPEKVPFRRVNPEAIPIPDDPHREWGVGRRMKIQGVDATVRGMARWPNGRLGVVVTTGSKLDTMFTVPLEWFDALAKEARR